MNQKFQELKDQRDKYLCCAKEIDAKLNELESNSINVTPPSEAYNLAKEMVGKYDGTKNMEDIYFVAEYLHHCKQFFIHILEEVANKRDKELQDLKSIFSELKK